MGSVLENGLYLPDEGERNAYDGLKGNWNTLDNLVETVTALSSTGLIRKPVDALPITDIQTNVIYLLKATKPNGDVYRIEYMYIDDHWDAVGTSETTLDDYYTKTETDNLPAVKSGVNATKVSNYDTHIADTDIHVTLANKQTWDGKQNALDTAQTAAVNSGVTGTKVTGYDTHVNDTDIHVTAADKTAWNGKQDGLSQTQLAAVNSGITSTKVTGYDSHVADTDVHVTTADKATWSGKQDALTQTQLDNIATIPDKANSADLATVATSGSYTDLINAPTIPTVNNATLTIQKNGTDVATFTANASSNVTANLSIPVNTSDLNNDAGFLTQHNPVDNELSATSENALQNKVVKSELDGKAPLVHTHAASDVTSGTFNIARIPNLDASKITSGTIDIARLPKGSLERLIKVANQAARYALTTDDVQLGDTVQQLDTGVMYVVTDETKLDSANGYTEFTAGSASSVPWSGVTGKPADYTPASHSHGNITNDGKVGTTANLPLITGTGGAVQAGAFGNQANTFCEGNDSRLSDARTPVAHTHGKADITDLFNSANTWSALNTYSNGQIRIKSQSQEKGVIPSSNVIQYLEFADKNNAQHGIVGLWDYSNGASEFQMYITDKFKNGAKDPTGTSETTILSFGFKTDGSKFLTFSGQVDNSVIPKANNSYDLGSSSYQWNNLYAKNYYYNGTAWGLDKANVYSTEQTISAASTQSWNVKNTNYTLGENTPSADKIVGSFVVRDKDNNNAFLFNLNHYSNGEVISRWLTRFKFTNGVKSTTGAQKAAVIEMGLTNSGDRFARPGTNGDMDLGTSSYKWKTLNGVNPGALSLPSNTYTGTTAITEIDRTGWVYDGTANSYTPPVDCWLSISNGGSITVWGTNTAFGMKATDNIAIPLRQGETYNVSLTHSPDFCRIYPCLGNV